MTVASCWKELAKSKKMDFKSPFRKNGLKRLKKTCMKFVLGMVQTFKEQSTFNMGVSEYLIVRGFTKANYKFNPNKPGNFQWQSVDDGFLMVVD